MRITLRGLRVEELRRLGAKLCRSEEVGFWARQVEAKRGVPEGHPREHLIRDAMDSIFGGNQSGLSRGLGNEEWMSRSTGIMSWACSIHGLHSQIVKPIA